MKKLFFSALVLVCLLMIIVAADFRSIPSLLDKGKKGCVGYTIIEFDKGIDCHGDTIRLTRKNGYAERVESKPG
jgi:hypothetical protein